MAASENFQMLGIAAVISFLLQRYVPQYFFGTYSTPLTIFSILYVLYLTWTIVIVPRFVSPLRHLPTPPGGFFLAQTRQVMREPSGLPAREWIENLPNNGLIKYSFWFRERLLVTNPQALGEVLVTKNYDFVKPGQLRAGLGRLLGVGILLAEGDEHKLQRKNLMPAFAFRHIKDLYPVFWQKSREMTEEIVKAMKTTSSPAVTTGLEDEESAEAPQHAPGSIEVSNFSSRATLDIIGLCGMGQDFGSLKDESNKLNQTYRSLFSQRRADRILGLIGIFVPFWIMSRLPVKRNFKVVAAAEYIKQLCRDLIAKKREKMARKEKTEVDIISVALESGGFTDEELVNQMMTFLVAGHETTATAMVWAMYLLSKHQDIQKKLRDEIRSKLPSLDSDITAADIDSCQYLHAVCTEVLRLWAPVSLTLREAAHDTSIQGQFVPKGTNVILAPWAINASTHLWGPDALEFKPERWLDVDGKANNKGSAASNFSFLTFLHGPRSCIGQKFAQAEFECLLAAWVGKFETNFEDGSALAKGEFEIQGGITQKPKGGVWVQLKELDDW